MGWGVGFERLKLTTQRACGHERGPRRRCGRAAGGGRRQRVSPNGKPSPSACRRLSALRPAPLAPPRVRTQPPPTAARAAAQTPRSPRGRLSTGRGRPRGPQDAHGRAGSARQMPGACAGSCPRWRRCRALSPHTHTTTRMPTRLRPGCVGAAAGRWRVRGRRGGGPLTQQRTKNAPRARLPARPSRRRRAAPWEGGEVSQSTGWAKMRGNG